jgi:hypothetical protein
MYFFLNYPKLVTFKGLWNIFIYSKTTSNTHRVQFPTPTLTWIHFIPALLAISLLLLALANLTSNNHTAQYTCQLSLLILPEQATAYDTADSTFLLALLPFVWIFETCSLFVAQKLLPPLPKCWAAGCQHPWLLTTFYHSGRPFLLPPPNAMPKDFSIS